jgi:hypothetical protein
MMPNLFCRVNKSIRYLFSLTEIVFLFIAVLLCRFLQYPPATCSVAHLSGIVADRNECIYGMPGTQYGQVMHMVAGFKQLNRGSSLIPGSSRKVADGAEPLPDSFRKKADGTVYLPDWSRKIAGGTVQLPG